MKARLQKVMAQSGLCSRRKAEEFLRDGRVSVNGRQASLGDSADPESDTIEVDGHPLSPKKKVYYALNKPPGYECTLDSTTGKPLATELVRTKARIFPVGRLDVESRGLLILTNDGDFANRVIHPRNSVEKEYRVEIAGRISDAQVQKLMAGIVLDGKRTKPCLVVALDVNDAATILRFIIHEGRKRQIRRMLAAVGVQVMNLTRERVGNVTLAGLGEGQYRRLTSEEIRQLLSSKHLVK